MFASFAVVVCYFWCALRVVVCYCRVLLFMSRVCVVDCPCCVCCCCLSRAILGVCSCCRMRLSLLVPFDCWLLFGGGRLLVMLFDDVLLLL